MTAEPLTVSEHNLVVERIHSLLTRDPKMSARAVVGELEKTVSGEVLDKYVLFFRSEIMSNYVDCHRTIFADGRWIEGLMSGTFRSYEEETLRAHEAEMRVQNEETDGLE